MTPSARQLVQRCVSGNIEAFGALSRGGAWYHVRVHNSKDHSPQAESKRRRSFYWDHRYVVAMDETSTAALLQRLWIARDCRRLVETDKGIALAKEVIAISDRHPKIWNYHCEEAEAFLKEPRERAR